MPETAGQTGFGQTGCSQRSPPVPVSSFYKTINLTKNVDEVMLNIRTGNAEKHLVKSKEYCYNPVFV